MTFLLFLFPSHINARHLPPTFHNICFFPSKPSCTHTRLVICSSITLFPLPPACRRLTVVVHPRQLDTETSTQRYRRGIFLLLQTRIPSRQRRSAIFEPRPCNPTFAATGAHLAH
ncbi:hypothetical protein LY76DRAFT_231080 [Colletotrichum caudatum]|nr:hypothetical protein LY76DRAFT_231080 [Colletotrichum caudatum]